jgi:hypothetical protein
LRADWVMCEDERERGLDSAAGVGWAEESKPVLKGRVGVPGRLRAEC